MAKEAVILVADTHINSVLGLLKPGVVRDDGESYQLNQVQKFLWKAWEEFLTEIDKITEGYTKNLVLVGDIVELDAKARSWQIITQNPSTAITFATDVFEPLVARMDTTFVVRGTEAHTGKSAWAEEEIAKDFDTEPDPQTGAKSWWHLRASFSGVRFDIAHHHSMGRLPWTYANSANKLAFATIVEYVNWGEDPPHLAIRAHNHQFADSGRTYMTRGIFLPAWQFHTAYLHRIGKPNAMPDIGGCIFLCDNGQYEFVDRRYKPQRSTEWKSQSKASASPNS